MQSDALCIHFNDPQYYNCPISRNHDISNALYNGIELKNDNKMKAYPRNIYPPGSQKEDLKLFLV